MFLLLGPRVFYKSSQQDGWLGLIASSFLNGAMRWVFRNDLFREKMASLTRLSMPDILARKDQSGDGYRDVDYDKGGKSVSEQQRGLILPLVERAIESLKSDEDVIIEIGTGNGDILAALASSHGSKRFVGIDFNVQNARTKHSFRNVVWKEAYALDLFGQEITHCDLLFGSSTFCFMTPPELAEYLRQIRSMNTVHLLLSEPFWDGYRLCPSLPPYSRHLENGVWFHNYPSYLSQAGFRTKSHSTVSYRHPVSDRPDLFVTLIHAHS